MIHNSQSPFSVHEDYFHLNPMRKLYNYDPTDDGPECEVITRILAHHSLYVPGVEKQIIKFSRMLDIAAIAQFSRMFADISEDERNIIRNRVAVSLIRMGLA